MMRFFFFCQCGYFEWKFGCVLIALVFRVNEQETNLTFVRNLDSIKITHHFEMKY